MRTLAKFFASRHTNIIESVHRQFRKLTKTKGAFPNENSLLKLLYMGIQNATKKWNMGYIYIKVQNAPRFLNIA